MVRVPSSATRKGLGQGSGDRRISRVNITGARACRPDKGEYIREGIICFGTPPGGVVSSSGWGVGARAW